MALRIKTWVNEKVKIFVNEHWPEKEVYANYTNDSWRIHDENRYIQVSMPIRDRYLHYEIINDHIELHFEFSGSADTGISAYQGLVDYLEKITESNNQYEWSSFLNGDSIRCVYLNKIIEWEDMLLKLEEVINYFDPIIEKYNATGNLSMQYCELDVNDYVLPTSSVDLVLLNLKDVLTRNLQIPDYQRIYCWTEHQVICLLDDLLLHLESSNNQAPYRLGTIILHIHDNMYDIIDGQQRLVTLSLLLKELGVRSCLMDRYFESSIAREHVAYNKFLIDNYVRKHVPDKAAFSDALLTRIDFSVLLLKNTSIDLAYTFFSNENSRGVTLTDYDLLKAHHLRFIPQAYEQQSRKAAENWNLMIVNGSKTITEQDPIPDYDKTLDTYVFCLRQWMRMVNPETYDNDRHIKKEYEAAAIMPELPPFGERFYFNEPIQGGTHFFSFVDYHLAKYHQFIKTKTYTAIHTRMTGYGSIQWYRDAIESLAFGYFEKFGEHCLSDASVLIMRFLLQNRYDLDRAQKNAINNYVAENGIILMIDQATSPTFFLAELFSLCRNYPIKYLQNMKPIQRYMRRIVREIMNDLAPYIYVESIKSIRL